MEMRFCIPFSEVSTPKLVSKIFACVGNVDVMMTSVTGIAC